MLKQLAEITFYGFQLKLLSLKTCFYFCILDMVVFQQIPPYDDLQGQTAPLQGRRNHAGCRQC